MKRPLCVPLLCLLAAAVAHGRGQYMVSNKTGGDIPILIENHNLLPVRSLRVQVEPFADWLLLDLTAANGLSRDPKSGTWTIAEIASKATMKLTLNVKVKDGVADGQLGKVRFSVWRDDDNPAADSSGGKSLAGKQRVPLWRSWRMVYDIVASFPEKVEKPSDIEWHLFEARRGSEDNECKITIKNTDKFDPLKDIAVLAFPARRVAEVKEVTAGEGAEMRGVGITKIDANSQRDFFMKFSVDKTAALGDTDVIHIEVRTTSAGAEPNPWDPKILLSVAPADIGLPGNFEAVVYYNLPPREGEKASADPATWIPVPKGTKISVSQVYDLPTASGEKQRVEQFIGYGNILDDTGYLRCSIQPVNQPVLRFRLVADTIANRMDIKYRDGARQDIIEKATVKGAWAAVTPQGKRTFRSISHLFQAQLEKEASILIRPARSWYHGAAEWLHTAAWGEDKDYGPDAKKIHFYRVGPGQENLFVMGEGQAIKRILLPFYAYEQKLDGNRKPGIAIDWQGELSTGGYISFVGSPMSNLGVGLGAAVGYDPSYTELYERVAKPEHSTPGIIYHNRNELLNILGCLVRAEEYLLKLDYFKLGVPGKDGKWPEPPVPIDPRGVIAFWRNGLEIKGGETGYALRDDGTWRLVVQGKLDDPDQEDVGLIYRGFGAAIRRGYFKQDGGGKDGDQGDKTPDYPYYTPTTLRKAWEQGFDIFFAACVLDKAAVNNEVAAEAKQRKDRSVDLDEVLAEARKAVGDKMYTDTSRKYRGADNAVAVAAGLWRAANSPRWSHERILSAILWKEGGSLAWFLDEVARHDTDLLADMMALGLCPRVERWPPASNVDNAVKPEDLQIIWHPNGVISGGQGKVTARIVYQPASGKQVSFPLQGSTKDSKEPVVFDFGSLRDGKPGNDRLLSSPRNGEHCFWTIETTMGKDAVFTWPLQDFVAKVPSFDAGRWGRTVSRGPNDHLAVSPGALPAGTGLSYTPSAIHSVLDDRTVLGGAVYSVGIEPTEPGVAVPEKFLKPVELALGWGEKEDPGQGTPAIYRLNPETRRWDLVSKKREGERKVVAMITEPGSYALMADELPPRFEDALAAPDPFLAQLEGVTWKLSVRLSEPATVSAQIEDKAGAAVHPLLKDAEKPAGQLELEWDGTDAEGKKVKDGVYTWRLTAVDESKLASKPFTGTVTVFSGVLGSASGEAKLVRKPPAPNPEPGTPNPVEPRAAIDATIRVEALGTNVATRADAEGKFWLIGLTPGAHTLRFSAQGHFDEDRPVEVKELKEEGDEVKLEPVTLTNVALEKLHASSEVFTPDGDGEKDYVSVGFTMLRECPLEVLVYGTGEEPVATLQQAKKMAKGEGVLLWQGIDDDERPQPSGWYTIRFVATNRAEAIPQGEVKVLLDRGLVHNAHAFPFTFSPNGDGFDDSLEIGYNVEGDALVTIRLLRRDGSLLKEIATDAKQERGWTTVVWDGKGPDDKVVPDGKYGFEIRPKYPTGHESIVARGEFMADSLPPEVGEVQPLNGSTIKTGMPAVTAKVLSDLADLDPSQLRIKIDENTVLVDQFDPKTGVFSYTPKTSLGEGVHIAIAYAQDWASNYAPPQAVSFTTAFGKGDEKFFDRTKPEASDVQPAKGTIVYTPTPLVTARVRDTESGIDPNNIAIFINGERVTNSVRSFIPGKSGKPWDWYSYEKSIVLYDPLQGEVRYVPLEPMKEGKNHVEVEVLDKAGNKSAKAETIFEVVVDTERPVITDVQPANGAVLARPEVVVSAKVADAGKSGLAPDTLRLTVDGAEIALDPAKVAPDKETGIVTIPLPAPLSRDAQHAISLTVRDRAGNISEPAVSIFNIVEDGEAPRADLLSTAPEAAEGAIVLFAAAVYDLGRSGIDESRIVLTLDGKAVPRDDLETPAVEGYLLARGLLTCKFEKLARGRHVASLAVQDKAGNPAKETVWQFEVKP